MRINPDKTVDLLYSLSETLGAQKKALREIASGKTLGLPSDDPAGMAAVVRNHSKSTLNDVFVQSIGAVRGRLQMTDATLGSVVAGLQRAVTLGVQGATGTLSDADRVALAEEVSGVKQNLLNLANSMYDGNYLFAGTEIKTQPFIWNSDSDTVSYAGNLNDSFVELGNGRQVQVAFPGKNLFTASAADMFGSLALLVAALKTDGRQAAAAATQETRRALEFLSTQRVAVGNALAQLGDAETELNQRGLDLSTQENEIAGADLAKSISKLLDSETARNALLGATGQISRSTLLDYIPK